MCGPTLTVVYFGILLLLVFLILWYVRSIHSTENLKGNRIYTAGATLRSVGQQFTSTNQGVNENFENLKKKDP